MGKLRLDIRQVIGRGQQRDDDRAAVLNEDVIDTLVDLGRGAGEAVVVDVGEFLRVGSLKRRIITLLNPSHITFKKQRQCILQ